MKKYILALCFTILCFQFNYGQDGPPPPAGCECCADIGGQAEIDCVDACNNWGGPGEYCVDVLPLDSNIFLLFGLAISFGAYSVYQNKRRLLKN